MAASWKQLWSSNPELDHLVRLADPSAYQSRCLGDCSPMDAPAIGFELSKQRLRLRPQIAAMLISSRISRWQELLGQWLRPDGTFTDGLRVADLEGIFRRQANFLPEIWVEWAEPLRPKSGQPLMLFRRPTKTAAFVAPMELLENVHAQMGPLLRERFPLPDLSWWQSLAGLPLLSIDQIGFDFTVSPGSWRLLFSISNEDVLLRVLGVADYWREILTPFPLQLAVKSSNSLSDYFAIEVLPLYRREMPITAFAGRVPADVGQWPNLPRHRALIPRSRLEDWIATSVYTNQFSLRNESIGLRGGVNHQKLVFSSGEVVDHKVYLGVMVSPAGPQQSPTPIESALALLSEGMPNWHGFSLRAGVSDAWIPLTCLTLLKPLELHPKLAPAYQRNAEIVRPILLSGKPVGYSHITPPDLDSSLWLMRYTLACGMNLSDELLMLLHWNWNDDLGLSTYPGSTAISEFIGVAPGMMAGWCSPHDCVLANLAAASDLPHSCEALTLLRRRLKQGYFRSYWWPLDGIVLSLLPRGSLPRSVVSSVAKQVLSPSVLNELSSQIAFQHQQFVKALVLLRHGTVVEQSQAEQMLAELIKKPEDFGSMILMQLPEPSVLDPLDQPNWIWCGDQESALAPDKLGYLAASLLVRVLLDGGFVKSC